MKHHKLLIVDDEEALREVIGQRLARKGYEIFEAGLAQEGISLLKDNVLDIVLLDLRLPDGDGLEVLQKIKEFQPDIQIIILTGHGTLESAIEAMKLGAFDYLTKPCNLSELEITLQKALEQKKLLTENTGLRQVLNRQTQPLKIIGESPSLRKLLDVTQKVAQSDAPVLIQGESGTGKELIARAVHLWSNHADKAYIPVNSGAIPEGLLESELFGHEKGAFTGASTSKIGLVEMADGGTLFLDEIGDMPMPLQVKLLRFLETGEFRRVGDARLRCVDVRIVAATNRNLQEDIEQERFRQDLYYRLNTLTLKVPPLRERRDDIILLAEYFLETQSNRTAHKKYVLSTESKSELLSYDFPGNVRELAHLITRGVILANGQVIEPSDIWPEYRQNHHEEIQNHHEEIQYDNEENQSQIEDMTTLKSIEERDHYPTLEEMERDYIFATLKKVNGNRKQAAKLLGISVRNLYRKIEAYGEK